MNGVSGESFDLFGFYRFMLATLATVYSLLRLILFIWEWRGPSAAERIGSPLLYRYLTTLLWGVRLRRFAFDFLVIAGLTLGLMLLIRAHV